MIWFLYLQASKWTCYCFMDAVRRHETPGQRQRTLILTRSNRHEHHVCTSSSLPLSPMEGDIEGPRWMLHVQWVCVAAEEHCTWGNLPLVRQWASSTSLSFTLTNHVSKGDMTLFSKISWSKHTLRNGSDNKQSEPHILGIPRKTWRNISNPLSSFSPNNYQTQNKMIEMN